MEHLGALRQRSEGEDNPVFRELLDLQEEYYRIFDKPALRTASERSLRARLERYRQQGRTEWEALTLAHLSRLYWITGRPGLGLEFGLRAHDLYHNMDGAAFPVKLTALYDLADQFYYYRDFETAARLLKEALDTRGAAEYVGRNNVYNMLGLCARNSGKLEEAAAGFTAALAATAADDSVRLGIIKGNLGITRFLQKRYEAAIPLILADIHSSLKGRAALGNAVKSMACLGEIYLEAGSAKAGPLLDSAWSITRQEHLFDNDYGILSTLYPRLARLAEQRGQTAAARDYWKAAATARDSLAQTVNALVLAGASLNVEAERHAAERASWEKDLRIASISRYSLLAGIMLLATIAILLIRRMQAQHELRHQQATSELEAAVLRLEAFTQALLEKNALIDQFRQQLEAAESRNERADQGETVTRLRSLTILTEDEWIRFQVLFEKVHQGFFHRLATFRPGLTPADVRYVALKKLGFSNKEIASVLGIGSGSVRSVLSRLRKRLELGEEESLEDWIARI